jgi:Mg-chelatase subunit ChlD
MARPRTPPCPPPATPAGPAQPPVRRPRRAWLTYALLAGALLSTFVALAANRRGRELPLAKPTPVDIAEVPGSVVVPTPPAAADLPPAVAAPQQRPRVELVFALDTTGSMGGLIEGAKRKIWSLASFVAQGQPTPELRVGLIGYRDVGDAYVTRVYDLDDDLDRVYQRLRRFRADGGGDTPEHVSRALHEAVNKMSWSTQGEAVKVIYLVGDAPPHTDYHDGYDYAVAARTASQRGIQVHTIRCGDDHATEATWRRIALLGKGQFMTIGQDGGMHDEHTRYDDELARLHDKLSETTVAYGAHRESVRVAQELAAAAPAADKAERAGFMAFKGKSVGGKGDLVEEVLTGAVKLEDVKAADLRPSCARSARTSSGRRWRPSRRSAAS